LDDRRTDGGTNSTLRTKEQGRHLTLNEHDDDDDDDDDDDNEIGLKYFFLLFSDDENKVPDVLKTSFEIRRCFIRCVLSYSTDEIVSRLHELPNLTDDEQK